jgi:hypothetical protein
MKPLAAIIIFLFYCFSFFSLSITESNTSFFRILSM